MKCQWDGEPCYRSGWTNRGLCSDHHRLAEDMGLEMDYPTPGELRERSNPLVCICPDTDADLSIDYGQCARCGRKPPHLFAPHLQERMGIR